jgi:hypothetical protein
MQDKMPAIPADGTWFDTIAKSFADVPIGAEDGISTTTDGDISEGLGYGIKPCSVSGDSRHFVEEFKQKIDSETSPHPLCPAIGLRGSSGEVDNIQRSPD